MFKPNVQDSAVTRAQSLCIVLLGAACLTWGLATSVSVHLRASHFSSPPEWPAAAAGISHHPAEHAETGMNTRKAGNLQRTGESVDSLSTWASDLSRASPAAGSPAALPVHPTWSAGPWTWLTAHETLTAAPQETHALPSPSFFTPHVTARAGQSTASSVGATSGQSTADTTPLTPFFIPHVTAGLQSSSAQPLGHAASSVGSQSTAYTAGPASQSTASSVGSQITADIVDTADTAGSATLGFEEQYALPHVPHVPSPDPRPSHKLGDVDALVSQGPSRFGLQHKAGVLPLSRWAPAYVPQLQATFSGWLMGAATTGVRSAAPQVGPCVVLINDAYRMIFIKSTKCALPRLVSRVS